MTSPFDAEDGEFLLLANGEQQRSLWPAAFAVPRGWEVELGPTSRRECLDLAARTWTDIRPASTRTDDAPAR